ncbi:glutathione S-transferase N-terminal domain-containing protein [Gilvimarinus agarilyticus]|uniref:glutathione S-transferase N-terminal domain-containing protein n=1 Tax=Gilvimarinus sp. 2_MG-2023 TaxID=3062666 RepID=UPI001C09AC22|nr:glutathione S-transferase N-terminal domain-containing protein [Gilvimarinus sp. 2_MG-2023]MBU2885965.1 glutathione S-transferase N-terminal domain-containing protein [Gilvimarinus agarilyticus]MDO6570711.1 glutathione S-transferase N-terminal domain-containing protein [Gilvimarinus sp. 2_MG-2023]
MQLQLVRERWPAKHPSFIQLYSMNTPNGIKVALALEEMGLKYEPHLINILEDDQFTQAFKVINPNSKIPALIDPNGPDDHPISLMESGAILRYLADKTGEFTPLDRAGRSACDQWLFFQVGHIGPMFGQFGHFFKYAVESCDHPYPVQRYTNETRRLLGVLDEHLQRHEYMLGESYSIVDMAIVPWVEALTSAYKAAEHLQLADFTSVTRWEATCTARPAYQRARQVCAL